jgi:hypothetical protein
VCGVLIGMVIHHLNENLRDTAQTSLPPLPSTKVVARKPAPRARHSLISLPLDPSAACDGKMFDPQLSWTCMDSPTRFAELNPSNDPASYAAVAMLTLTREAFGWSFSGVPAPRWEHLTRV